MKPRHRLASRLWGTFEANSIIEVRERPRRDARLIILPLCSLIVTGLLWAKLELTRAMSRLAFSVIYGCFAAWTANVLAAAWGAGNSSCRLRPDRLEGACCRKASSPWA